MSNITLSFSQIKTVKDFSEDLHSSPDYKEVVENIVNGYDDFEVDNVRFIKDDSILEIMVDEIFSDEYVLGCFYASFIASNSSLPIEMIEACQECEAFEAIGKALNNTLNQDEKEAFCEEYASADGYGHHFNSYDFSEEELTINGKSYHVFDNH